MARRRLELVGVTRTEDGKRARILTRNPDALRGGLDELELDARGLFGLIASLAEIGVQLDGPAPQAPAARGR